MPSNLRTMDQGMRLSRTRSQRITISFTANTRSKAAGPPPTPPASPPVDPSNPGSWNRYSYVLNDPMDLIDPFGLCPRWGPFTVNGKVICTSAGTQTHPPDLFGSGGFFDFTFCPPEADCINGSVWAGPQVSFPLRYSGKSSGGNNAGPGLWCNPTTGICVPASAVAPPGPDPFETLAKNLICTHSFSGAVGEGFVGGMVKGGVTGAVVGATGGEVVIPFIGGVPGAAMGGLGGMVVGSTTGLVSGIATAVACKQLGAYN